MRCRCCRLICCVTIGVETRKPKLVTDTFKQRRFQCRYKPLPNKKGASDSMYSETKLDQQVFGLLRWALFRWKCQIDAAMHIIHGNLEPYKLDSCNGPTTTSDYTLALYTHIPKQWTPIRIHSERKHAAIICFAGKPIRINSKIESTHFNI